MIRPIDTLPPLEGEQAEQYARAERMIDELITSEAQRGLWRGVRVNLAPATSDLDVARRICVGYGVAGWLASLHFGSDGLVLRLALPPEIARLQG